MEQFSTLEALRVPHGHSNHSSKFPPNRNPAKREWEDDDSEYESDPSELRFPENSNPNEECTAWMVKLPPCLAGRWKEVSDLNDDDEEILLGTIRVKIPKASNDKREMRLKLNPSLNANQDIPQEYNLGSRGKPHNIYCWAEEVKDVPEKQTGPAMPIAFIERSRRSYRGSRAAGEPKETTFRRPSKINKTSFVTKFRDELLATPIRTEGAATVWMGPQAAKKQLGYISPTEAQINLLRPGTVGEFSDQKEKELLFTAAVSSKPVRGRDPKDRAYRMNKDVLISSLYKLFEMKENWTTKEFREALFQPEDYLKQVLREICVYNQDGPMVGAWTLNSNSKEALEYMKEQKNEN
ncbi:hypothetical protein L873DRAFT_1802337 [Choiromyces venosus 120613-1]|uniref:Transcription initiation factor IIF subunit beta n=1 Tax=Choiromyces venosus 120613-1 TaxID=1336337 RepID=A0A3N4JVM1_9PEZI|nr:hypothetical protein L873DRAFT_1802337 [Choiromyces venosus 120613-1]